MSKSIAEQRQTDLKVNYDFDAHRAADQLQPALFDVDLPAGEEPAEPGPLSFETIRRREAVAVKAFREQALKLNLPYWETFRELLDGGFPPRIAAYIAWAASPRQNRWPKTQDELAHLLGLTSDRQFTKWRRNYKFIDELILKLQIEPLLKHRADVFAALIESASTPDYKHQPDRKLLLEITGDYVPTAQFTARLSRSVGDGVSALPTDVLEQDAGYVAPPTEDDADDEDEG